MSKKLHFGNCEYFKNKEYDVNYTTYKKNMHIKELY